MLKTLIAAAIALTTTLAFGGTANSAGCLNCGYYNGNSWNGLMINGLTTNGIKANGQVWNGANPAGAAKDQLTGGMKVLSVELPTAR